jgi:hypothetical protein
MEGRHHIDKLSIVGLAVGFLAFLLYGMLYGALIGGAAGQEAGIGLFGYGLPSRAMSAAGIVAGILVSGVVCLSTGFAAGKTASLLLCIAKKDVKTGVAAIRH